MIHKEGKWSLIIFGSIVIIGLLLSNLGIVPSVASILVSVGAIFVLFFLQFFRNPDRSISNPQKNELLAPADGKIVVIEKAFESEYYKEERMQISIFMSPMNVHVNRAPFDGIVKYKKHHKGKFLMAFNPKSSTENERCTTVFERKDGISILYRQVAGFLARRIVNYVKSGTIVEHGKDYGFIKLGSRVDIFLPLDAEIMVSMDQAVKGNIDCIAKFK